MRTASALLVVAFFAASCGSKAPRAPTVEGKNVALAMPALDGGTIETARYRGRIVVLHAFTTWSIAAQSDVDQLRAAHSAYSDADLVVIGIGMDVDGYDLVSPWRSANAIPYLIALATDPIHRGQSALGKITQVPTTFVIDRRGTVVHQVNGPLAAGQLDRLIEGLGARK